jgi:hypothetical protein
MQNAHPEVGKTLMKSKLRQRIQWRKNDGDGFWSAAHFVGANVGAESLFSGHFFCANGFFRWRAVGANQSAPTTKAP